MMLTETLQLMHMFVSAIKICAHAATQFPNYIDKIEDNKMVFIWYLTHGSHWSDLTIPYFDNGGVWIKMVVIL